MTNQANGVVRKQPASRPMPFALFLIGGLAIFLFETTGMICSRRTPARFTKQLSRSSF